MVGQSPRKASPLPPLSPVSPTTAKPLANVSPKEASTQQATDPKQLELKSKVQRRSQEKSGRVSFHSGSMLDPTQRSLLKQDIRVRERKSPRPSLAALRDNTSRRVKYVREKPVVDLEDTELVDVTVRCEEYFLRRIERYKDRRLERFCVCPLTKWLFFKENLESISNGLARCARGFVVLCCPPLCYTLPRIAFWPPKRDYYFYRDPKGPIPNPPRSSYSREPSDELLNLVERKRKHAKLTRANKLSIEGKWRIGLHHPCADEIEGVEAFVLRTSRKNYIACVRVPCDTPRYYILYSHPNASDISDHLVGVPNLQDMARFYHCEIFSYDYSGYGVSTGSPSEKNQKADIRAVYEHMTVTLSIPCSRIILLGYSIGSVASVDLIQSMKLKVAGLILQAPVTSILRVLLWGRACINQPFAKKTCCADRFSVFDKILDVTVPTLVIHGEYDVTVPIAHGMVVCERAINRKPPLWLRCSHDNIENCREVWLRIRNFIKKEVVGAPKSLPSQNSTPPVRGNAEKRARKKKKQIKK